MASYPNKLSRFVDLSTPLSESFLNKLITEIEQYLFYLKEQVDFLKKI